MIYLDTSVVVPLFVAEPTSEAIDRWLAQCNDTLVAADWLQTEFASALAMRQRRGALTPEQAELAHLEFAVFIAGGVRLVPTTRTTFARAAELARNFPSGLRSGDSLHLAAALDIGVAGFATADLVLATNAEYHGLAVWRF